MTVYRVDLVLRSSLGTPLAADTLWGHLAWGIRYSSGRAALEDWLNRYDSGTPPLILSDPFPDGFLPRPILPPTARPKTPPTKEQSDQGKRLDKRIWIPTAIWPQVRDRLDSQSVEESLAKSDDPISAIKRPVHQAAINRLTGGTAQENGGTLYNTEQSYFETPPRFNVWVSSPEPRDVVSEWFQQGLAGGYGRDAATGRGQVEVVDVVQKGLPAALHPNAVMLLGSAVPRRTDPLRGFFQCGTRAGRVGGEFSISSLPNGSVERQKRPFRCLMARTVLCVDGTVPDYVGQLLTGVHSWAELRHYALGLCIPVQLTRNVLDDPLLISFAEKTS